MHFHDVSRKLFFVGCLVTALGCAGEPAAPADAATADLNQSTVDLVGAAGCTCSPLPCACDDHMAALCQASPPAGVYHLQVVTANTTPLGACVFVKSPTATFRGDVVTFAGADGTGRLNQLDAGLSTAGYQVEDVKWDATWEDTDASATCTTEPPGGCSGPYAPSILSAAARARAVVAWIDGNIHSSHVDKPLCAVGSSGGSSELLYLLYHYGAGSVFRHVQLMNATPFARLDYGCDVTQAPPATGACSGFNPVPGPQFGAAATHVGDWTHNAHCGQSGGLSAMDKSGYQAQSVLTASTPSLSLPGTTVSAFLCQNYTNATSGGAFYVFGASADLATAPAAGSMLSLGTAPTYQGARDSAGKSLATKQSCTSPGQCPANVVCEQDCTGVETLTPADLADAVMDVVSNCK